jgi:ribonuclease P protein component
LRETFKKGERLTGKDAIATLFRDGVRMRAEPFKVVWRFSESPEPEPVRILIIVPKSLFPRAVDRNLIRRRIREAYRKTKGELPETMTSLNRTLYLAISYQESQILDYKEITGKIIVLLHRLNERIKKSTG